MRILYLGNTSERLAGLLDKNDVRVTEETLDPLNVVHFQPDLIVSFGYRHKVPVEILSMARLGAFNIHISLLPWNGGSDPNFWSWLTNTPKGVTVHWMNERIDRGDIAAQREVDLDDRQTLRETYEQLQLHAADLMHEVWPSIQEQEVSATPMPPGGTYYRSADKDAHAHVLTKGWDTPCDQIAVYGRESGLWVSREP